jgi:hypothetical protein
VLYLNADGTVDWHQKISNTEGNFTGVVDAGDCLGSSVASLGDLDGDGSSDLAAGALGDDDGGAPPDAEHGAVWVLFLEGNVTGDLNCDGSINGLDIHPFVLALTGTPPGYPEYYAVHPDCDVWLSDCNHDGSINGLDIHPFVEILTGG